MYGTCMHIILYVYMKVCIHAHVTEHLGCLQGTYNTPGRVYKYINIYVIYIFIYIYNYIHIFTKRSWKQFLKQSVVWSTLISQQLIEILGWLLEMELLKQCPRTIIPGCLHWVIMSHTSKLHKCHRSNDLCRNSTEILSNHSSIMSTLTICSQYSHSLNSVTALTFSHKH